MRRRPRPSAPRLRARRDQRRMRSRARGNRCWRTRRSLAAVDRRRAALRRFEHAARARRGRAQRVRKSRRGGARRLRCVADAHAVGSSGVRPSLREQRAIGVDVRIAGGEQLVAVEDRIGAGEETQRLHRLAHLAPAGGQAHHRLRHRDARHGDRAHELERIERASPCTACSGVPSTCTRLLIGTDSGYGSRFASCAISPARCARDLAHADDAAAADVHAGVAHALERVEPVLVVARGDDLAVELGRGVEVVVVVVEARVAQLLRPGRP